MDRVLRVLRNKHYDFVNLSIGPDTPVEDDDINGWTAALDDCLSSGRTLLTTAVGNEGQADADLGYNRIQPPSDCVNAVSVGASDCMRPNWSRAEYSCVGPGRSPGRLKPDLLAFGGSEAEPYYVLARTPAVTTTGRQGTSYAAPTALRMAAGIRAHFGPLLCPLAIRALLLHRCCRGEHDLAEVGMGRLCHDLLELVACPTGSVTTVYQGTLDAKQYLRAMVPFPSSTLVGKVTLTATICFATETDPKDTANYTRAWTVVAERSHNQSMRRL